MPDPRSILIVRLSALGDVIHVLPSLSALRARFPDAKIGWAIEDKAAALLDGHPQLDRVHRIPRQAWTRGLKSGAGLQVFASWRKHVNKLRAERYEVAIDFQSNLRSSFLTRLSGAPRRIGQPRPHSKEGSWLFFTHTPPPIPFEAHKIDRNLNMLVPLGLHPEDPPRGVLWSPCPPELAAELPPRREKPWAVLHAGVSVFGALKAWRGERFEHLGRALVGAGAEVFFSWGGTKERSEAERLVSNVPGSRLGPATTLRQLAWFLGQADLYVGVDSGPLHLAAMIGTPVLGLYGPKQVSTYGPYWRGNSVERADYPCSPCRHRRCPRPEAESVELLDGTHMRISPCMDSIDPDVVAIQALGILAARSDVKSETGLPRHGR